MWEVYELGFLRRIDQIEDFFPVAMVGVDQGPERYNGIYGGVPSLVRVVYEVSISFADGALSSHGRRTDDLYVQTPSTYAFPRPHTEVPITTHAYALNDKDLAEGKLWYVGFVPIGGLKLRYAFVNHPRAPDGLRLSYEVLGHEIEYVFPPFSL